MKYRRAPRSIGLLVCLTAALACRHRSAGPPRPSLDGVRFMARAEVLSPGDSVLDIRVRAINGSRRMRTLEYGACSMDVLVSSVGLTPERQWSHVAWYNGPAGRHACLLYLASATLTPGDSVAPGEYSRRIPIRLILGDSLPPGRYRVIGRVGANGRSSGDLDAGQFDLRRP